MTHAFAFVAAALILFIVGAYLTRPKRYYLIRHGRTLLNEARIKQGPEGALSDAGKKQARHVAQYLARFQIEKIYTSPYERAQETASIMKNVLGATVATTELLRERKNPSEVLGKRTDDPAVQRIIDQIELGYHDDDFRYSDEETFAEQKARAKQCLSYLASRSEHRVVVVTHHAFLKMLLAYMLYRNDLHAGDFVRLSFFNQSDNGGISICEYHPLRRFNTTRGWRVLSYNEQLG